jgi:hypothetical protein
MSAVFRIAAPGPCAKIVAGFFGAVFLITLLSVPVTVRTTQVRQEKSSNLVFRTTYPRNANMFLPQYLGAKADPARSRDVRLRSAQWIGTMAIVAVLGLFDYAVFCRLLRKRRTGPSDGHDGPGDRSAVTSLFS